ncbi:hypothetical protein HC028_04265 [Planosporangium flavigriseum]|uniref:Uncharacterized protein n=1 Tax=Planosporangium flavigriseum TaxID=373681 RepID=A0A8J3LV07_9ACTN|nr:hypothetical protein [Planosporangium flavigriseum]NJC63725.1 hypothetical protein [Planosporangium flavigriseum]GIG73780.1 hypothetical protein Pfl04_21840 [Planosporangium flavigriseum]
MPAADIQQPRAGLPLVPGLLWTGVGLAPVAALLVLLVGDNPSLLRFAVLLAVIAVALIGTALVLRRDSDSVRGEIEDMLFEELDILRDDVREDITTAARATHKAFGERVVTLQESVNSLRGEVENLRVRVDRDAAPAHRIAPPVPPMTAPPPPMTSTPSGVPPMAAPHGVVRHTETVKVTRQTIVDQNDSGTGTVYGGNRMAPPPVVPAQRRPDRAAQSRDAESGESWSERLLRQRLDEEQHRGGDRHAEARYSEPRYGDARSGSHAWGGGSQDGWRAPEPDSDGSGFISGVHAGDRWASARRDEHGHELRVGERRAAMHSDESGTELRVEGRWAAVRRDEGRGPEPHRAPESQWERGGGSDPYWGLEAQPDRFGQSPGEPTRSRPAPSQERRGAQAALPATPSEPSASSWLQEWEEEARRARSPRATGDDRWR